MENTEAIVQAILERNRRVEADKAWEVSGVRRGSILLLTYGVSILVLWVIGNPQFLLNALIPTGGYALSTLSLPWVKRWWIRWNSMQ